MLLLINLGLGVSYVRFAQTFDDKGLTPSSGGLYVSICGLVRDVFEPSLLMC